MGEVKSTGKSPTMSQTYLSSLYPIPSDSATNPTTTTPSTQRSQPQKLTSKMDAATTTAVSPKTTVQPPTPAPKQASGGMYTNAHYDISPEEAAYNKDKIVKATQRAADEKKAKQKVLVYQYRAGESAKAVVKGGVGVLTWGEVEGFLARDPALRKTVKAVPKSASFVEVKAEDLLTPEQRVGGLAAGGALRGEPAGEGASVAQVKLPFGVRVKRGLFGRYGELVILSRRSGGGGGGEGEGKGEGGGKGEGEGDVGRQEGVNGSGSEESWPRAL